MTKSRNSSADLGGAIVKAVVVKQRWEKKDLVDLNTQEAWSIRLVASIV